MRRRIALWSLVGLIVACAWVVFTMSLEPATLLRLEHGRYFWTVADITAPVALLRQYPIKYYWVVLLNGLAYALVGLAFELVRRRSMRHVAAR
ncbi:MAG TPA: hypothetical protein VG498_03590 [Terriglobales bacterium]|nr:hypothetical protein [Terriglobales bacterium]